MSVEQVWRPTAQSGKRVFSAQLIHTPSRRSLAKRNLVTIGGLVYLMPESYLMSGIDQCRNDAVEIRLYSSYPPPGRGDYRNPHGVFEKLTNFKS
jgi:hypothetical protein